VRPAIAVSLAARGGDGGEHARQGSTGRYRLRQRGKALRPAVPEQPCDILQTGRLRELCSVLTAIPEPAAGDRGDARRQDRFAPGDGILGDGRPSPSSHLALFEARDVLRAIELTAGIVGLAPSLDQAAADIGVERLRLELEPCHRF